MPTFEYEDRLRGLGYVNICGCDEAGRGPLCGPVVAAAVIFTVDKPALTIVAVAPLNVIDVPLARA